MINRKLVCCLLLGLPIYLCACWQGKESGSAKKKGEPSVLPAVSDTSTSIHHGDALIPDFNLNEFLEVYNYQVQYIDSGYINQDNFKDKVLVLQANRDEGKYLPRSAIILLGKKNGFSIFSESKTIMPAEYNGDGYKQFDTETVKIEEGKVSFDLYAVGPNGHIYFDYAWKDGRMTLHELTGYFMGAGSHSSFTYLATTEGKGTVKEILIHTMDEDMPSENATWPIQLKSATSFEHFDYNECLQEIVQQSSLED